MKWEDYHKIYWTYELSVNQTKILSYFGRDIFKEFPDNLPEKLRSKWSNNFKIFLKICEIGTSFFDHEINDEEASNKLKELGSEFEDKDEKNSIMMDEIAFYFSMMKLGIRPNNINFQRLFLSQELVMVIAHLEAFLSDSLRVICKVKPEILKNNKKIDRSTIISLGDWDNVMDHLIEDYIFEFGWKTLNEKISFLNEKIGLNIEIPDSELSLLKEAENIRNIVVHNGGKISQEYINRTKKFDLKLGDDIPIKSEFIEGVLGNSLLLGCDIFVQISEKFFNIDESKIIELKWRSRDTST